MMKNHTGDKREYCAYQYRDAIVSLLKKLGFEEYE